MKVYKFLNRNLIFNIMHQPKVIGGKYVKFGIPICFCKRLINLREMAFMSVTRTRDHFLRIQDIYRTRISLIDIWQRTGTPFILCIKHLISGVIFTLSQFEINWWKYWLHFPTYIFMSIIYIYLFRKNNIQVIL